MTMKNDVINLLKQLIRTESFSRAENRTADLIARFLQDRGVFCQRLLNNVWARGKYQDPALPTILLNSHHDTVHPNPGYTRNPFEPLVEDGKLFGLGSNDAGGALVSLLACFLHFYEKSDLKFNLVYAATAEEEISGEEGVEALLPHLGDIYLGIVGEPTRMDMAIAEKGLLVLDCNVQGRSGHAARDEGDNAIYKAMTDMEWFRSFQFPEVSETLGPVKMTLSMIQAGKQHNVVPAVCNFTVDVRTTDKYSNRAALELIRSKVSCEVQPRSLRLNSSSIPSDHPAVRAGRALNKRLYGSPTTSDMAVMDFHTIKMGPGDSARSHTADEFICLQEISEGIDGYISFLNTLNTLL